ncbi:oxidoreductase : Oxidoreductase domain protein OS=Chthoniobacter flavus Ellin428 GN=CfE428DRAFT_3306 PE=4 SV=1: GFO_IDH_MocA [Gemmata massiliana]|uniref:Gfo/Idh/MocA-like oxidoreductase N-terminal domain-containing protein n=1 Tax=Gemmata massiliana TaxID=1210884 RepID=A0A6P2D439_9BACT|nr:Gfo/Idh/MocA family oxidoreductase [Gemmata massiliana]VTR95195.1 oxidoreductase : Oxidoreductase domain protein OS=Chthoniobacter flavus Ellin428 GN=CfE428DRAFT_3306 PE=4 SV=1: GFO_IDH_MocA [Gemmata massiliana]
MKKITRRSALKVGAGAIAAPFVWRLHAHAAPSETVLHASFGASGMAAADISDLTKGKHLKLVAVAEVDENRVGNIKKKFPSCVIYKDYRQLLDKEKSLDSVNVSTPDHMHAPITMRAMNRGLHVYGQKPLTQTIHEARRITEVAAEKKLVTQMGIQIHSHPVHKLVVKLVQDGAIGKVKEVHSWSGKSWGDTAPKPDKKDPVPAGFDWDLWLGVASERPFIGGDYYHPGNWRKRLDFGTGTFGDMGCHILDPVFGALGVGNPLTVRSELAGPNDYNWTLDVQVKYVFPGTKFTTDTVALTWYNGKVLPPADVQKLVGRKLNDQGSIYIGEKGVMYSPYIAAPVLLPADGYKDFKMPEIKGDDHYLQFVEAVRGNDKTSAPFSYSGPLTEMVLLGCLSTRFPQTDLKWDTKALKFTNNDKANAFVKKEYRKGFEVEGL